MTARTMSSQTHQGTPPPSLLRPRVIRSVGWLGGGGGAAPAAGITRVAPVSAPGMTCVSPSPAAGITCVASSGGVTRVSSVSSSGYLPVVSSSMLVLPAG